MKKTQRQIDAEKIPEEYPVIRRFFFAVYKIITEGLAPDFKNFCEENDIEPRNLERLIKEPHRQFNPKYLTILVTKYRLSAHWLLTGEGEISLKHPTDVVK
ncbi:hypothetical protein [Chryseobacterium wangxinyae]|uniref:hypothetical protein n=1 Tax=Chryseobacterium sp. CY353 TaxID=2997334 RepID=UPI00226F9EDC|nr:hypothetical protein [Chryseobacterium sp. CY353]MCY0967891.1 hypothetical protein [Chryseobacterium sp. CY353]